MDVAESAVAVLFAFEKKHIVSLGSVYFLIVLDDGIVATFAKGVAVDVVVVDPFRSGTFEGAKQALSIVVLMKDSAHVVVDDFKFQDHRSRSGFFPKQ